MPVLVFKFSSDSLRIANFKHPSDPQVNPDNIFEIVKTTPGL